MIEFLCCWNGFERKEFFEKEGAATCANSSFLCVTGDNYEKLRITKTVVVVVRKRTRTRLLHLSSFMLYFECFRSHKGWVLNPGASSWFIINQPHSLSWNMTEVEVLKNGKLLLRNSQVTEYSWEDGWELFSATELQKWIELFIPSW
jgi:hypothetical protein